jgi:hypothetical protein
VLKNWGVSAHEPVRHPLADACHFFVVAADGTHNTMGNVLGSPMRSIAGPTVCPHRAAGISPSAKARMGVKKSLVIEAFRAVGLRRNF